MEREAAIMKSIITLIWICTITWGAPAVAAEKLLTDHQLDAITAGAGGDGAAQSVAGNTDAPHVDNASAQNGLNFGNPNAANVVNVPTVNVDNSVDASQNVNSKNDFIVLKDNAQQFTKAVNVENSVQGQVINGLNVHVNGLLPSGSAGGSLNNLYQTNIITVNHN
jgi:hypothetical protein